MATFSLKHCRNVGVDSTIITMVWEGDAWLRCRVSFPHPVISAIRGRLAFLWLRRDRPVTTLPPGGSTGERSAGSDAEREGGSKAPQNNQQFVRRGAADTNGPPPYAQTEASAALSKASRLPFSTLCVQIWSRVPRPFETHFLLRRIRMACKRQAERPLKVLPHTETARWAIQSPASFIPSEKARLEWQRSSPVVQRWSALFSFFFFALSLLQSGRQWEVWAARCRHVIPA